MDSIVDWVSRWTLEASLGERLIVILIILIVTSVIVLWIAGKGGR